MTDDEALERLRAVVPDHVREVCETLAAAGHEAVTVGGAVRDAILGRTPGDWDVATSATPEQVMALFRHTVPTGIKHGTVTVVTGRGTHADPTAGHVEVTTFRGEGGYTDGRRPDHVVFGVPLVDDLARRDLRVNAMAYDPAKHVLIDPYEGRRDIANGRLRAVGPTGDVYTDAVARFTEDGLRVMRAVRFAAQLEFALDLDTERGIAPALASLAKVSKERISTELRKILDAREPSRALGPALRSGIIELIAPELVDGFETWRACHADAANPRTVVVERWLSRVDAAAPIARLGALFAELARPGDPAGARRSDRAAHKRADAVLRRLKFSNDEIAVAGALVGTAGWLVDCAWTEPQVRRLLADVTRPHAAAAVALWRAAGAEPLAELGRAIVLRGDPLSTGELAVTGQDLMTELALAPGPILGKLLAMLLDRVLDDPSLGTREQLIEIARAQRAG